MADQPDANALATTLKDAFAALANPAVPDGDKPRLQQRLIAITNSAKHDVGTAAARLDRFWAEYEERYGPRPG